MISIANELHNKQSSSIDDITSQIAETDTEAVTALLAKNANIRNCSILEQVVFNTMQTH